MSNEDFAFLDARLNILEQMVFNTEESLESYIFALRQTILHPSTQPKPLLKERFQSLLQVMEDRLEQMKEK